MNQRKSSGCIIKGIGTLKKSNGCDVKCIGTNAKKTLFLIEKHRSQRQRIGFIKNI